MKVRIKPYPTWHTSNIHDKWMRWRYALDFHSTSDNVDWLDSFIEKLESVLQTLYNHTINLRSQEQKVSVEIEPFDVWSMDTTLAHIVVPMLKRMQEDKHGAPFVENIDVPDHLHMTEEDKEEYNKGTVDDNWFLRWDYILGEMLFAFESKLTNWEDEFYSGNTDIQWDKVELEGEEYYEAKEGPNDTFKVDRDGINKVQKRIDNGFRLFGKYYNNLWT